MQNIGIDDDDPIRNFSAKENEQLTWNLTKLVRQVRDYDAKFGRYSIELFRGWHAQLFDGVRDHAGKYRSQDYGEPYINFGPHRSCRRDEVANLLGQHVDQANKYFLQLNDFRDEKKFIAETIKVALYLHAQFIKIHPFRDGNGRVGRLIITFTLARHDIPIIALEVPKQEYIDCLNRYYVSRDLEPLYNLAIRLYKNQLY